MTHPPAVAARRLVRVRESIADRGLDGLLVTHLANLRYLTGFTGSSGWLLIGPERAVFATDGRYGEQVGDEIPADLDLELLVLRDGILGQLAERAGREFGSSKVGFEGRHLSYSDFERLREESEDVEWTAVSDLVERIRSVKDAGELELIEKAAEIAVRALEETLPLVEPGMREADIAAELDFRIRRLSLDVPAFETIVASGPRTSLPHAATGDRRLEEGDLLLFDFGARWGGYRSDLTRTFVLGSSLPRQREVYGAVAEAARAARAALTEGVTGADVDAAARRAFEARGMEHNFVHSTGHGLGLEVHEGPGLSRRSDERLEAGMVVTIEPGLYFPGWGGIRIEDDLVVTAGAPRPLVSPASERLTAIPS